MSKQHDIIIIGAGNAALCAAIAACGQGASVLALEKAPEYFRGGNTYFTGGIIRCAYNGLDDLKQLIPDMSPQEEASVEVGQYTEDDFYDDLMRVSNGLTDPELAQILVTESFPTLKWLQERGVRFVLAFGRQAFKRGDKYHFWGGLLVEAVGAGKATQGISPPKSNWALPIDTPPFVGYAVTCGITFTFGGLRIDTRGQVLDTEGNPIANLYAAGELVGGVFYHNYPGGSGLTSGAVFGRLAGTSAAADIADRE